MKAHSIHNVNTKPVLLRHKKSGKQLKVMPGVNTISSEDFFVFGNQIRVHPSMKMLRELNELPVAVEDAPKVQETKKANKGDKQLITEAPAKKDDSSKEGLNDTADKAAE